METIQIVIIITTIVVGIISIIVTIHSYFFEKKVDVQTLYFSKSSKVTTEEEIGLEILTNYYSFIANNSHFTFDEVSLSFEALKEVEKKISLSKVAIEKDNGLIHYSYVSAHLNEIISQLFKREMWILSQKNEQTFLSVKKVLNFIENLKKAVKK